MKPFGIFYSVEGCTCSLRRSRGYRKNNAYDRSLRISEHRACQQAKREIRSAIFSIDN